MKVSVIVACRNEGRHLRSFLDSLLRQQTAGLEVEFLIADGRSDDETPAILAEYAAACPRIRVIDNPGRIVSTGLNAAIRASGGDVIIRMDAHSEFAPDYVTSCVELLCQTGADNVGGPARTRSEGLMTRAIAAAFHSPFSTGGARFHDESYEGPVETVTYGCWRRQLLLSLGCFDESLVRNQDDELNLRLIRAGGRIWQSPRIVSWYRPRSGLRSLFRQYLQYGFWKVAVIRKHHAPASWRHLVPGLFLLVLGGLLLAASAAVLLGAWQVAYGALFLLATLLTSYALVVVGFSFRAASLAGFDLFPVLPLVFAAYHFSYGLGFLAGLLSWRRGASHGAAINGAFTRITR